MLTLGLMSGTSLDGLDIALCRFEQKDGKWIYEIITAETFGYDHALQQKLSSLHKDSAQAIVAADAYLAYYWSECIQEFNYKHKAKPELISSHGHTVIHKPDKGYTVQIGKGAIIAARTGITTVCDFRSTDVALGGQGAPLVPIGDRLLFSTYQACLNLGGIANISFEKKDKRVAFDIVHVNMILNYLCHKIGFIYDENGNTARSGKLIPELLGDLNALKFYKEKGAKSLGRELFEQSIIPIIDCYENIADVLFTCNVHIANQIAATINEHLSADAQTLVTGGGAFNSFLLEQIQQQTSTRIILPDNIIINYKEALIFAFLGCLRITNQINVLSSVTGSSHDSISGSIYL
ncbi:MAG: anhydro-N-acetylmuramic acid kinase [Bacteroidetes bacterium]|nr:anhydro-N-acetylmuramic acid kinase [Bacteroidota bacterium]